MSGHKKQGKNNDLHDAAAKLGKKGGEIGGPARARSLSANERSEIARKAANARWANAKRKQDTPSQKRHNDGKDKK